MPSSPPRKPNRYELPLSNMVGAMVVVVLFVLAFVAFRALNRNDNGVKPQPFDYQGVIASVRSDPGRLIGWAPSQLPIGWVSNGATYDTQQNPHWHLGITNGTDYMGIEEGMDSLSDELKVALPSGATAAGTVSVAGNKWAVYTGSHGYYAIARQMDSKAPGHPEWLVVVGTTSPQQVQAFAASLKS